MPTGFGYSRLLQQRRQRDPIIAHVSEHNAKMKEWLRDGKYLSPQIVNGHIKVMADHVLCQLLLEIRATRFFSIIADEATDVACNEQLSVVICGVNDEYAIHEDPIGFVHLSKTDAATIIGAMNDVLLAMHLAVVTMHRTGV